MLEVEVLIRELLAIDGAAASALRQLAYVCGMKLPADAGMLTLPRVKSPPWSMNSGMMRWKEEPL